MAYYQIKRAQHAFIIPIVFVLAAVLLPGVRPDCPDLDVRCRIAQSNVGSKVWTSGCEVGGSLSGTVSESVTGPSASATATINGRCFQTETESDGATFAVMGVIKIGQCYEWVPARCSPQKCGWTMAQMCNERIPDCTVYPHRQTICGLNYVVQEGDDCWSIADRNSMTEEALMQLNPSVNCDDLQPFQQMCLGVTTDWGQGVNVCEGFAL